MYLSRFPQLTKPTTCVLVTGHTGFKGTWLTLLLEQMQIKVVGLSLPADTSSIYSRLNRVGKIPEIFGDIRDRTVVSGAFEKLKPDVVIHLAAQPLVRRSYADPLLTFETNVLGTANLLQEATQNQVRAIGVVTTDKVYRNTETGRRFEESDPLGGLDPYSASKVGAEAAVMAWRSLPSNSEVYISALRAGNVIGGGDLSDNRLLPDIVRAALSSRGLQIRNKNATRPWQHVLDPLVGYLLAIEYSIEGKVSSDFNFGPEEESLAVGDVIDCVLENEYFNSKIEKIEYENVIEHEAQLLSLNASRAMSLLGWKPAWSQRDAIMSTMRWWEKILKNEDNALSLCNVEIERALCGYK